MARAPVDIDDMRIGKLPRITAGKVGGKRNPVALLHLDAVEFAVASYEPAIAGDAECAQEFVHGVGYFLRVRPQPRLKHRVTRKVAEIPSAAAAHGVEAEIGKAHV